MTRNPDFNPHRNHLRGPKAALNSLNSRSLHGLRVDCKRAHALLLAARSEKGNEHQSKRIGKSLKIIGEVKRGLEKFRNLEVLTHSLSLIARKKKNLREHPLIEKLVKKSLSRTRSDARLRIAAIERAKNALHLVSSHNVQMHAQIDLFPSYRKAYRLFRYCEGHSDQASFHEWRKKISIFRYQLEARLRADSSLRVDTKKKLKSYNVRLKDLSVSIGRERDIDKSEEIFSGGSRNSSSKSISILQKKKRRLKKKSLAIGSEIFAKKPKKWQRAIGIERN
jgi:CHAD domain-containing protein